MKLQSHKVQLKILTPVHMGTGEKYEMFDFVMTKKGDTYTMHVIDALNAMHKLNLLSLVDKIKMQQDTGLEYLQQRVYENAYKLARSKYNVGDIPISKELYNEYEDYMYNNEKKDLNRWDIFRTAFNGITNTPYIPSSGIKGAIKTAVFSHHNSGKEHNPHKPHHKKWHPNFSTEKLLHGSFGKDPFRHLKISDLHPMGDAKSAIRYIHRINSLYLEQSDYQHKQPIKGHLTIRAETLLPTDETATYNGTLTITDSKILADENKVQIANVLQNCNDFYQKQLADHIKILKTSTRLPPQMRDIGTDLDQIRQDLDHNSCIINIGKYGGAVLKTMDGSRHIYSRGKIGQKGESLPKPKTMSMVGENKQFDSCLSMLPMGWAILTILP